MSSAPFSERLLPYVQRLELRDLHDIDLVVIHCTELPDLETARKYGETVVHPRAATGNCGHYYVDRDGTMECWVPADRIAHHVRGFNLRSVGIELVNSGRFPDWFNSHSQHMTEPYPQLQVAALGRLLAWLSASFPTIRWIAGHEDLDREQVVASDDSALRVPRKCDPGPLFPWDEVLGFCQLQRLRPPGPKGP